MSVPDAATRQRQVLRDLAAEHGRQLRQILQAGELVKGSVYQIETRCGNPGCHCAQPRAAMVRLQQQMLHDIDRLEQALRLPPPPPAARRKRAARLVPRRPRG